MNKMAKRMQDIAVRKQHAIAQMKKEHETELQAAPQENKKSLSLQHDEKMRNLTQALDAEERKQHDALNEQLQKHQEGRRRVRRMALEQKKEHEYKAKEDEMRQEQEKIVAKQAELMSAKEQELAQLQNRLNEKSVNNAGAKFAALRRAQSTLDVPKKIRVADTGADDTAGQEEVRRVAEAVTQPLMERMEALEAMLRGKAGGSQRAAYHDMRDAAWAEQGTDSLKPMAATDLSAKQREMYPFAQNFVNSLQEGGPRAITDIVPAASVPKPTGDMNAFGNSYSYDPNSGALHIRAERLENPGEMMLILAHANAHIRSGDMSDDSSPEFQREFYKSLMGLMGDLGGAASTGGTSTGGAGFSLQTVTSEEEAQRTTQHLIQDITRQQAKTEADELQRRETKRVELERKRTEMRKKAGNLVKENIKARLGGGGSAQDAHKLRAQKNAVQKLFATVDKDGDGKIGMAEFKNLVEDIGVDMSGEEIQKAFDNMDHDHNNSVDFEEVFVWYVGS